MWGGCPSLRPRVHGTHRPKGWKKRGKRRIAAILHQSSPPSLLKRNKLPNWPPHSLPSYHTIALYKNESPKKKNGNKLHKKTYDSTVRHAILYFPATHHVCVEEYILPGTKFAELKTSNNRRINKKVPCLGEQSDGAVLTWRAIQPSLHVLLLGSTNRLNTK